MYIGIACFLHKITQIIYSMTENKQEKSSNFYLLLFLA